MSQHQQSLDSSLPPNLARFVDEICDRFEVAWRAGDGPRIEDYLDGVPTDAGDALLRELLATELELASCQLRGHTPRLEEYLERFASHEQVVRDVFRTCRKGMEATQDLSPSTDSQQHHGDTVAGANSPGPSKLSAKLAAPITIGRYAIGRRLGSGAFGDVFLAHDTELKRLVAVKVPHANLFRHSQDEDLYLNEARIVAALDHPHIVPVYDVGRTADGRVFVVSKYIEGSDLSQRIAQRSTAWSEAAELIARVAEALHYAHKCGLVHRDIKPANILLDSRQQPYVADFGLALREDQQCVRAGEVTGTPAYMAPEQVRGETHRLDGRTDIWSLGAVLYELLTGRKPFAGETQDQLFDEIEHRDPKPLRMINDAIPAPLEMICLRAIAKDPKDRFQTAGDMAAELRRVVAGPAPWRRRYAALAGTGLLCGALAVAWVTGLLPRAPRPAAIPTQGRSVSKTADVRVSVWQRGQERDLARALPLHSGDDVQIVCQFPPDLKPALFWFDTAGELHDLSLSPVSQNASGNVFAWPATDKSNVLGGPAGTELIFVCASRTSVPKRQQVAPLLSNMGPWPMLPEHTLVNLDQSEVSAPRQYDRTRGPTEEERYRPDAVIAQAERLRAALSSRFDLVRGVAFAHVEP